MQIVYESSFLFDGWCAYWNITSKQLYSHDELQEDVVFTVIVGNMCSVVPQACNKLPDQSPKRPGRVVQHVLVMLPFGPRTFVDLRKASDAVNGACGLNSVLQQ